MIKLNEKTVTFSFMASAIAFSFSLQSACASTQIPVFEKFVPKTIVGQSLGGVADDAVSSKDGVGAVFLIGNQNTGESSAVYEFCKEKAKKVIEYEKKRQPGETFLAYLQRTDTDGKFTKLVQEIEKIVNQDSGNNNGGSNNSNSNTNSPCPAVTSSDYQGSYSCSIALDDQNTQQWGDYSLLDSAYDTIANLSAVHGDFSIDISATDQQNDMIADITAFSQNFDIRTVDGDFALHISGNATNSISLDNLGTGLSVGGNAYITIDSGNALSIRGLGSIVHLGGQIHFSPQNAFQSLTYDGKIPSGSYLCDFLSRGKISGMQQTEVCACMDENSNGVCDNIVEDGSGGDRYYPAQNTCESGYEGDYSGNISCSYGMPEYVALYNNLQSVSGNFSISVSGDSSLGSPETLFTFGSANGFSNLSSVGGNLTLTSSDGTLGINEYTFKNLTSVGGNIDLQGNSEVIELSGFKYLQSLGGSLLLPSGTMPAVKLPSSALLCLHENASKIVGANQADICDCSDTDLDGICD